MFRGSAKVTRVLYPAGGEGHWTLTTHLASYFAHSSPGFHWDLPVTAAQQTRPSKALWGFAIYSERQVKEGGAGRPRTGVTAAF